MNERDTMETKSSGTMCPPSSGLMCPRPSGTMHLPTALTIAGSDCSGGAGIQADIKSMTMQGVYAMSVITALTAQNTTGVRAIMEVDPVFLGQQLDAVFTDIFPDAVKIGMVSCGPLVRVIADKLRQYGAKNIVVDPVMVATSGSSLMPKEALQILTKELFPTASLITPNLHEAGVLAGFPIRTKEDMERAAALLWETYGCGILIKGGHCLDGADDLLFRNGKAHWFTGKRIDNPNTHGTGCTLSSAVAARLASGEELIQAIAGAKDYLSGALRAQLNLGTGSGPLWHGYELNR